MDERRNNPAANPTADYVVRILEATEHFEVAVCDLCIAEAFSCFEPVILAREVLGPVLRGAGERWHKGQISVVQEHLLSGTVRRQLFYALDQYNRTATGPRIAFTTLSGERHEMGTLMCAVIAASRGFRCVHLGPDLPAEEIALFCNHVAVAAVALSVVGHPAVIDGTAQLGMLRQLLPAATELWIGGEGADRMHPQELPSNTYLMKDLTQFMNRLPLLAAHAAQQTP